MLAVTGFGKTYDAKGPQGHGHRRRVVLRRGRRVRVRRRPVRLREDHAAALHRGTARADVRRGRGRERPGDRAAGRPRRRVPEYGRSLFPWLRVGDNVELPLRAGGTDRARRRELVDDALTAVGLSDARSAYPWQLSGGMQQRVAIARAIAFQPKVLLMDEPFAAVDAQTRADLEDVIRGVWARLGVTLLFVTHDIDEAVYLGQRVVMLSASPTTVAEDLVIDLLPDRDQLTTRSTARFTELRAQVYAQLQKAKQERT